ncbi:TonB-dependent receptor [Xanthomonas massiliensis]|uniref:TonB-dependent receptor n=1 Tax=Xanthomonas massiliensis TaxID=1720302 RepID=UPI000824F224|nr:TonB-dependent receptor [Xanthomonas massiliensis]
MRRILRSNALALALALAASGAHAQSTTGSIFGTVAGAQAGETVLVENTSGFSREARVDDRGRYTLGNLPLGTYKVTLKRDGQVVETRENVSIVVGAGTEIGFGAAGGARTLDAVQVSAASVPKIDVASVDSRTVITAEQLQQLPIARSAEAIALLAPGVVNNSGGYISDSGSSLVSFGGSAASENAYYLNGFNTTDPYRGLGGLTLPYGAIDQQEIYTGGYSAQYGRSNGGVINQVGKRGTNDWKFGGSFIWEPDSLRANARDLYYKNGYPANAPAGALYRPNSENKADKLVYSAYAGGPIVKDKLFFFVAAELARTTGDRLNAVTDTAAPYVDYTNKEPRWYAKLDWNITDNHFLELTGAQDKYKTSGAIYRYDYADRERGTYLAPANDTETGSKLFSGKYTGYFGDNITLTGMYGRMESPNYNQPLNYDSSLAYVTGTEYQNPAITGGQAIGNGQTVTALSSDDRRYVKNNWRINLNWRLGDHSIDVGIDDMNTRAIDLGSASSGPGYSWTYGWTASPYEQLSGAPRADGTRGVPGPGNFANGQGGYYVIQNVSYSLYSLQAKQRAQYIEDKWQVNDKVLLSLGLRNDQFTNYNPDGDAYIKLTSPQWAPRLGVSWDVFGDSSFKVYGDVGRYYLGLPLGPGGLTNTSLSTSTYYTYSGIDANGYPTGLTQMAPPVSANANFGGQKDYRTAAVKNLEAEHQDEFIAGFNKVFGENGQWVFGTRLTYRTLKAAIDDYNFDNTALVQAAEAAGFEISDQNVTGILINPGKTNTFNLLGTDGQYHQVTLTREQMGFPELKRNYYAAEFTLERPFDGTWYTKLSYVFSRSYGTTEGQLRSDLYRNNGETVGVDQGQLSVSTTQSWDHPALMENFNGPQSNDHTHQFKAFGYYQISPEWGVSGNVNVVSGAPKTCLSYYYGDNYPPLADGSPDTDPAGYGGSYHFCDGKPSPPGKQGRLPWTFPLDLGLTYKPSFGEGKLAFNLNVFNVFNQQRPTYLYARSESAPGTPNPLYGAAIFTQTPRYARLTVSYDF